MKYESPISLSSQFMTELKFFKSRSNFKVKVTRSKLWNDVNGLVTRNAHMQYESPSFSGLKIMAKVLKFLKSWSNFKVKVTRSTIMV